MKNKYSYKHLLFAIGVLALSSIFCSVGGDEATVIDPITATVSEIQGTVQTLRPEDGQFLDASIGQLMRENDQLLTHQDARARLDLSNNTIVRVGPLSHFVLQSMEQRDDGPFTRLKLEIGELFIILNGGSVDVDTPSGLASVRGSYMSVLVIPETRETIITCLEGFCQLGNGAGAVNLVAGQSALVQNFDSAPTPGVMDDDDVSYWLEFNPEATLVLVPLTATVAASGDGPPPPLNTPTYTPTATPTCPPPGGWTAISIVTGDSFASLAEIYGGTAKELADANCMDVSAELTGGQILFVPPQAGDGSPTPTLVQSATPSQTPTAATQVTPPPTSIPPSPTTNTGSDTNLEFVNPSGPVDFINACENLFSVDVFDVDGVDYVEVEYSVNDSSFSNSAFVRLTHQGGSAYKGFLVIETFDYPSLDTVYWRFATADLYNNHQWFPALGTTPFSYDDELNCGAPVDPNTLFTNIVSPENGFEIISCANEFSVDVSDPEGVDFVKVDFSINDPSFAASDYFLLSQSGGTWSGLLTIPTTTNAGKDTVYWRFWVIDGLGNYSYYPSDVPFFYYDPLEC